MLTATPPANRTQRRLGKHFLWTLMGLATLSVFFYSEVPLFHKPEEQQHLHDLRWLLLPHAFAATFALLSGPFQFSNRLRNRHTRAHRILGRLYVGSVFIAAPLAMLSTLFAHYPKAIYFQVAIAIQGSAWLTTTAIAPHRGSSSPHLPASPMDGPLLRRDLHLRRHPRTATHPCLEPPRALLVCRCHCLHHLHGYHHSANHIPCISVARTLNGTSPAIAVGLQSDDQATVPSR